ncbi:TPA: DEAD/DEAH box helicase family protein [Listeria monocytogenes]|nr:restriction endonuclease subunit R [Listeria monocytogenes]HDI4828588.1 DEAD/DEAH box helicase family protein [Listeria monocytogenes]HDM9928169.1 DEAD/DEAH box helicase family protein [Listeria monocytogenes]
MSENYFIKTATNIIQNSKLREPQIQAYAEVYDHFITKNKTKQHAIVVLPTGSGKTGLISLLPYNISKGRVLIIAPQLTILDTLEKSLDSGTAQNFWRDTGVINNPNNLPVVVKYEGRASRKEHLEQANIVIANIQKLQARNEMALLNQYESDFFDMIIIDEAHHSEAKTWIENLAHFSDAKIVKLTATAYRSDKKPLVGELVYKYKLSQAMSKGYVKSLEKFNYIPEKLYFTIDNDLKKQYTYEEIIGLNIKDEDWIARSVVFSDECKLSVVKQSIEILTQKRQGTDVPHKIIAAATNIEEAKKIAQMYSNEGMKAVAIYHELPSAEKENAFSNIENNRVDVIVNVSMMGEGYDHKYLSVAAVFKVFKSPLPYEQFIGRILRAIPKSEMKKSEDNVGSVVAHNFLFLDELWEYYKSQLQESSFITELSEIEIPDAPDAPDAPIKEPGEIINVDFGKVDEQGEGNLERSVYMETNYIIQAQEEAKERQKKINELIKLLNITETEASDIINTSASDSSELKRPDVILKRRKKSTDTNIRQVIVPEILVKANLDIEGSELKDLPIFLDSKYRWIPQKIKVNGGMLATYFNAYLKNSIGYERALWSNEDYERAGELLEQQAEYLKDFFGGEK